MAVNLSPLAGAGAQFFTDAGTPLTGGLLYTYLAGTTTPAATYTDLTGVNANSNPIVLNAAGRVPNEIWLLAGTSYKFVLKTATLVTIGTWDNIDGVNDVIASTSFYADTFTTTAGQTTFTLSSNPGSINNLTVSLDGAVLVAGDDFTWTGTTIVLTMAAYVNQRLRVAYSTAAGVKAISPGSVVDASVAVGTKLYNRIYDSVDVRDYGADPTGVADSTLAIQAALAANAGGAIYFPKGTYKITASLTVQSNTWVYGVGPQSLILQYTSNIPIFYAQYERTKISDLGLKYNTAQTGANVWANAIHCQLLYESILERLWIYNAYTGVYCKRYTTSNSDATGNYIYSCRLSDIRIDYYGGQALLLSSISNNNSGNILENIYTINGDTRTTVNGVVLENWDDGVVTQLNIEHATHTGSSLLVSGCNNVTFNGLHFESITCATDYQGLIDAPGSRMFVVGMTVAFNTLSATNILALFRLNNSAVTLSNVQERNNTATAPTKAVFYSVGGTCSARIIGPSSFAAYTTTHTGLSTYVFNQVDNYVEADWTPVVTAGSGTITTVGAVSGKVTRVGRLVTAHFSAAITTNGTGAGQVILSGLPYASSYLAFGSGRENGITGNQLLTFMNASSTQIFVTNFNGTYPGANGAVITGTLTYLT